MKVKGTMLLSPVIGFKCLSKGQIVLVIKKEVFIKTVMQLPRGWFCRHGSWMSGESSRAQWVPPFPDSLMYSFMLSFTDFFFHTHPFSHSSVYLFYSFSSHLLGLYGLCAGQGNRLHLWEVLPCIFSDSSYWLWKSLQISRVWGLCENGDFSQHLTGTRTGTVNQRARSEHTRSES